MHQANLTRFGPESFASENGETTIRSASFRAIDGPARLVLTHDEIGAVKVVVNGATVIEGRYVGSADVVAAIDLTAENTIEVTLDGESSGSGVVRVTQVTTAELGLQRQGYFGLNTSDLERQRKFYEMLGFVGEIYPAGGDEYELRAIARIRG